MPDIRHRVGIAVPRDRVYEEIASTDGLAEFWAEKVEGDPRLGGRLSFFFGGPSPAVVMEVVESKPGDRIVWRCVEGPAEWLNTTVTYDLKEGEGETVLLFTHAGWRDPVKFMHHCSTKWATFLIGLRSGLEGGPFAAHPNETSISSSWR